MISNSAAVTTLTNWYTPMLKHILAATTAAAVLFASGLFLQKAYPQSPRCVQYEEVRSAHNTVPVYNIIGNELRDFAAAYERRFSEPLSPVSRITIFVVDQDNWYLAMFDANGCMDPQQLLQANIQIMRDLLIGTRANNG